MRRTAIALSLVLLTNLMWAGQSQGTLCIAPVADTRPERTGIIDCGGETWRRSLKIDGGKPMAWPTKSPVKIDGVDLDRQHKLVVLCDGKPQQSVRFKFSKYKTDHLCILLNGYQLIDIRASEPRCCR